MARFKFGMSSALLLFGATLIAGCTLPHAEIGPAGRLEIFGPQSARFDSGLPADWALSGAKRDQFLVANIRVIENSDGPVLRLWPADKGYVLARRTLAALLASPFLSWSWNIEDHGAGSHPIKLAIGFFGGNPSSGSLGSTPFLHMGNELPPFDRILSVSWGAKTLQRGTLLATLPVPRYIARGGRENVEKWWSENIDLADLYARSWPKDDIAQATIMFVGFASSSTATRAGARFRDIVLSR